ncbi:hypothetical protein SAMN05421819_1426 [Bryocella elongata]|uniref:Tetratricopeptide repeat-containing protein n=1 Tax=Bryocella elongata TaxID=863522 RepID=A0A1H5W3Y0_9BACT|nr:tetratricopeptide repeat protein [Bryocella elongata]SEF94038.1 hypothetical protein SAMN05421819_1426 [Bryocella elongata]
MHFIRRRPDTYWLYIILFLGPIGAVIYLLAEALPDAGSTGYGFRAFPRRKRIRELQMIVKDNPSTGNYEELGDLYLEENKPGPAREAFEKAIAARGASLDAYYRRGICAMLLGEPAVALPDFERVVDREPDYDFYRAGGLLAHMYALTGQTERAEALFQSVTRASTRSETYLHYAEFFQSQGRHGEAREWAQKVLDKKPTMPGYLKRRERPWFRRAKQILKQLPPA